MKVELFGFGMLDQLEDLVMESLVCPVFRLKDSVYNSGRVSDSEFLTNTCLARVCTLT